MTWAQPPFYVHSMIAATWLDQAVNVTVQPPSPTRVSAAVSGDGLSLVVRYVNDGGPDTVTLRVSGMSVQPTATMWQLQSDDLTADNTPADPENVAAVKSTVTVGATLLLPAQSYTVLLFTAQ